MVNTVFKNNYKHVFVIKLIKTHIKVTVINDCKIKSPFNVTWAFFAISLKQ